MKQKICVKMEKERNRQTGRTTRIIDFVIEQLHSVGECIVTDHTVFEFPDKGLRSALADFIEKTNRRLEFQTSRRKSCTGTILKADKFNIVHFKMMNHD